MKMFFLYHFSTNMPFPLNLLFSLICIHRNASQGQLGAIVKHDVLKVKQQILKKSGIKLWYNFSKCKSPSMALKSAAPTLKTYSATIFPTGKTVLPDPRFLIYIKPSLWHQDITRGESQCIQHWNHKRQALNNRVNQTCNSFSSAKKFIWLKKHSYTKTECYWRTSTSQKEGFSISLQYMSLYWNV